MNDELRPMVDARLLEERLRQCLGMVTGGETKQVEGQRPKGTLENEDVLPSSGTVESSGTHVLPADLEVLITTAVAIAIDHVSTDRNAQTEALRLSAEAAMLAATTAQRRFDFERGMAIGQTMKPAEEAPKRNRIVTVVGLLVVAGLAVGGIAGYKLGFFDSLLHRDEAGNTYPYDVTPTVVERSIFGQNIAAGATIDGLPASMQEAGSAPMVEKLADGTLVEDEDGVFAWRTITVSPERSQYLIAISIAVSGGFEADAQVKKRLQDGRISDEELIRFLQVNNIIDSQAAGAYGLYVKFVGMNNEENLLRELRVA